MAVTWDAAAQRAETFTDSWMDRLGWALLLYATAGAAGQDGADVTLGQLRYQVEQPQASAEQAHRYARMLRNQPFIDWLHNQLQAMGHEIRLPEPPPPGNPYRVSPRLAEPGDPVADAWALLAAINPQPSYNDYSDGVTSTGVYPHSLMWEVRDRLMRWLNQELLTQVDGWTAMTPIRTVGREDDAAVVLEPVWDWDHEHRTLRTGAPVSYVIGYGSPPYMESVPVVADHLIPVSSRSAG